MILDFQKTADRNFTPQNKKVPLIKTEHVAHAVLGVWESTESDNFFLERLPQNYLVGYEPQRFSERRRKEFLASRWLLKELLESRVIASEALRATRPDFIGKQSSAAIQFIINDHGKLKDSSGNVHLSLSHSGNRVAAIVSTQRRVGIDIEEINPRVLKVMHKFLNEHEKGLLGNDPALWRVTLCWSAKESIFKMAETPGMMFSKQMAVNIPTAESGLCVARAEVNGTWHDLQMGFEKEQGYVLTWCEMP